MEFPVQIVEMNLEEHGRPRKRVAWGVGRVVFRAKLANIQDQLNAGWPMSTIYHRLEDSLAGLSYRAFTKLVNKYCGSSHRPTIRRTETLASSAQPHLVSQITQPSAPQGRSNGKNITAPGKPTRFQPGPRNPNPADIY